MQCDKCDAKTMEQCAKCDAERPLFYFNVKRPLDLEKKSREHVRELMRKTSVSPQTMPNAHEIYDT